MPGRGPLPSAQRQRDRDNRRRASDTAHVTDDGELRGPDFPHDVIPTPHPATVAWWTTWRRAPQAQLFLSTDWQVLRRAARLQEDVMTSAKVSAAAVSELRLIEERLGATYADRLRARITVDTAPALAPVTELPGAGIAARLAASRAAQAADELDAPDDTEPPF
ncbi:hypothetical protein GCM10022200_05380 [Microbacterium awajiense]|uniref:Uncharacterized protein n=1 Tax=Microbacterium awajiense TaxID=415214 RepID=A0ABP7A6V0_9MICO